MSNDSCNTLCWNVSKMNNSIHVCLIALQTHALCCDQISFVNQSGMLLVVNIRNKLRLPTFFDRVSLYSLADARLKNNMLVCYLVCLSTFAIRPFNRILSMYCWDFEWKITFVHPGRIPITFLEELRIREWFLDLSFVLGPDQVHK